MVTHPGFHPGGMSDDSWGSSVAIPPVSPATHDSAPRPRTGRSTIAPRTGEPGPHAVVLVLQRQREIGDARLARGIAWDVGRLDVAVDEAACVRVMQRVGKRRHQCRRLPAVWPLLPHSLRQVALVDVLRNDVAAPLVGRADVVDGDDVGLVELCQPPGLGQVLFDILRSGDGWSGSSTFLC